MRPSRANLLSGLYHSSTPRAIVGFLTPAWQGPRRGALGRYRSGRGRRRQWRIGRRRCGSWRDRHCRRRHRRSGRSQWSVHGGNCNVGSSGWHGRGCGFGCDTAHHQDQREQQEPELSNGRFGLADRHLPSIIKLVGRSSSRYSWGGPQRRPQRGLSPVAIAARGQGSLVVLPVGSATSERLRPRPARLDPDKGRCSRHRICY
jgi:hypothetical protein